MRKISVLFLAIFAMMSFGCSKVDSGDETPEQRERKAINLFLKQSFDVYYYWIDSMRTRLDQWGDGDDPVEAYGRFKHGDDRWGFVSDNGNAIEEGLDGVTTSYGYNGVYMVYKDTVVLVVEYASADTPASKAGIKRGDVFSKFNGKAILYREGDDIDELNSNLRKLVKEVNSKTSTFTYAFTGKTVTMTPEKIYENPILVSKVFDFGGKKVAYLHYTQFDLSSMEQLVGVFSGYKAAGVSEMILDLRYNGGGYVIAEELIASMAAPLENVLKKDVYTETQYNQFLSSVMDDKITCFSPLLTYQDKTFNLAEANPDLKKIYVLVTGNTASASEILINGLLPYTEVHLFGETSYGKTASCLLILGKNWYENYKDQLTSSQYSDGMAYASDWCGYITFGYNVNALGEAACNPYGFEIESDKTVEDKPYDGYQLGDPEETMLAKVLSFAGYAGNTKSLLSNERENAELSRPIAGHKNLMLPAWGYAIETTR